MVELRVQRDNPSAELPGYGYPGDAGMDLAVAGEHTLDPGESRDLPTGLRVELPEGVWGRITGRSSTLRKRGLFVNEGVIDTGYRGELFVYVTNRNVEPTTIEAGTRLAQLILAPVVHAQIVEVDSVADSERGTRGFGSTGWTRVQAILDASAAVAHMPDGQSVTEPVVTSREPRGDVLTSERAVDPPVGAGGQGDAPEFVPVARIALYCGGPLDYVDADPEARHRRLVSAAMMHRTWHHRLNIYCPACAHRASPAEPDVAILKRNLARLLGEWAIFEYRPELPSIGTPIELEHRAAFDPERTLVVGTMGDGLYARFFRSEGVREVDSMTQAISIIYEATK